MELLTGYSNLINLFGLLLDMTGALLMFFFTPLHSRKPELGSSGSDIINKGGQWLFFEKALEKKEHRMIKLGFIMLIAGFVAQFLSAIFQLNF